MRYGVGAFIGGILFSGGTGYEKNCDKNKYILHIQAIVHDITAGTEDLFHNIRKHREMMSQKPTEGSLSGK
jgi:hypothetical protein